MGLRGRNSPVNRRARPWLYPTPGRVTALLKLEPGPTDTGVTEHPTKGQTVDAAGAETLRQRLEQQLNWRSAEAVRDGRQPSIDPDIDDLEEMQDDVRLYAARRGSGGARRMCKRLIDGLWQVDVIDLRAEQPEFSDHDIANVA